MKKKGCWILLFRLLNGLLVQTYFNPDEFWQAGEVAHSIVFGYGYRTWEWGERMIRGFFHPLIFAAVFYILKVLQLDHPLVVAYAPRVLQSVFAAVTDMLTYRLAKCVFDRPTARWALFFQLTNWFSLYCLVRPFANSLETMLTMAALYLIASRQTTLPALVLIALSCLVRPTAAALWVLPIGFYVFSLRFPNNFFFVFTRLLPVGAAALALGACIDRVFYGEWVLVPLNFLKFNVWADGASYYGSYPWHWYVTEALPAMLLSHLPCFLAGVYYARRKRWLATLVGWLVLVYSFSPHKEYRFILPVFPLCLIYCAVLMRRVQLGQPKKSNFTVNLALVGLIISQGVVAGYLSVFHQRAPISVMRHLADEAAFFSSPDYSSAFRDSPKMSVLFLMPCHHTPFYASIHVNISMHFLDCTPPPDGLVPGYMDDTDRFQEDPVTVAKVLLSSESGVNATHVVLYASKEEELYLLLSDKGFTEKSRFFHTPVEEMVVYTSTPKGT